jgi:hypothetical protein
MITVKAQMKRTLITGRQPHDDDVLRILLILVAVDEAHRLIVDERRVRVVDRAMSTDEELRRSSIRNVVLLEQLTQPRVRINDVGNAFGGVEARYLDDILAGGPGKLIHLLL